MKVIFKPNRIESYEAIQITEDMIGKVLTDTDILKQKILKREDGKLILRANEIDKNTTYESIQDIDIFLEIGDILIKTPKGYMKPVQKPIIIDKQQERAIKKINEVK
ncbi:MAG: hypothetical protein PHS98_05030 [Bacilli bacterium]|nr:hypothetical protein [Bacilli bacterium]